jgi:hypothetical protein
MLAAWLAAASAAIARAADSPPHRPGSSDEFLIVDCLLPPKLKRLGTRVSYAEARKPIKTSALDCGIRGGEYTEFDRADYRSALAAWRPLAEQGDAMAQNYVGEILERGLGTAADPAAAAAWYRKAAEQDFAPAALNLGELYDRGAGVERDPAEAQKWYRRASGLPALGIAFTAAAAPTGAAEPPALERQLAEKVREIERLQSELRKLSAREQRAAELDATLREREQKLAALQQELAGLTRESETRQARADAGVALAGPGIQLIDPALPLTRGLAIPAAKTPALRRAVVGKVDAPAGLLLLTVNDAETAVDAQGMFRSEVEVPAGGTQVAIVAVDRQGKRSERRFALRRGTSEAVEAEDPRIPRADWGTYHALVIGNNAYRELPKLATAVGDAKAVAALLESEYGFEVTLLVDADRYQTLSALNQLREKLTEKDNLLIYYAGHGELDEANMRGHWLPIDAEPTSSANWISNVQVTDVLNAMSARHVLVIADSCYSGALTRSALASLDAGTSDEARKAWIQAMLSKRSRTALSSGGLEPVLDAGGGEHSVFARVLLEVLRSNRDVLEGQRLFQELSARVTFAAGNSQVEQLPQYAPIKYAGHEAGDFFFVPKR